MYFLGVCCGRVPYSVHISSTLLSFIFHLLGNQKSSTADFPAVGSSSSVQIRCTDAILPPCCVLTAAFFPGKLKNESGPFLCAMYFRTDKSFTAWRGCKQKITKTHKDYFRWAHTCRRKHMDPCYTPTVHAQSHELLKASAALALHVLNLPLKTHQTLTSS